jgi:heat shock protein HtpX
MFPAFGLYTHIQANRRRSAALLVGLFLLVNLLTFGLALLARVWLGISGEGTATLAEYLRAAVQDCLWWAPGVTLATGLWIALSFKAHQAIVDWVTGAEEIGRVDDPRLFHLLENLCIARGLAVPKLKIVETDAANAFATGLDETQYAITVTRGLLATLDEREVEAVLAHELTHIRNGDVRMLVIAVIVTGVISFVAEMIFRGLRHAQFSGGSGSSGSGGSKKKGGAAALGAVAIALVLLGVAWGLSLVIRFALMRSREYLADAGAVELTKNPDAMISALRKIEGRGELEGVPSGIMEMCVDNPRSGWADLFATHPSIEQRIEALVRYGGGRYPVLEPGSPEQPSATPVPPIAPVA